MLETSNAVSANRTTANNLEERLFESKARLKDLEIKMDETTRELYATKSERNTLLNETFNLRKENKELKEQIQSHNSMYLLHIYIIYNITSIPYNQYFRGSSRNWKRI